MEAIGSFTKESLVMNYSKLSRDELLRVMADDVSKHISAVAAYTWFLHQGLESDKWSVDEKKDFTEQILKASVAISAIVEAGREVELVGGLNDNTRQSDYDPAKLQDIGDALRELAARVDALNG